MKLTWLGHGTYRVEAGEAVLIIDPWFGDNPSFDDNRLDEAIAGATHILVTHAHADHTADVAEVAEKTGATVVGIIEYAAWVAVKHQLTPVAFNMGGTVDCGGVAVTMVRAVHSSSIQHGDLPYGLGTEASFMLSHAGTTLYVMGDTDVHADMAIFEDLHKPDYALVPIGGHFTMDARRAAYACNKFFNLKAAIPYHYGSFPNIAQSADEFVTLMEETRVLVPTVMEPFEI